MNESDSMYFNGYTYDTVPDVVTVKFGLVGFDGSNDRVVETREIEIDFENFLGRDIAGDLVMILSGKIKSLLDDVLHGGLYNEGKSMIKIKQNRKVNESVGDAQDIYAEANELFYKALSKYRRAKIKAINDGLDYKSLNRLGMLIEDFSDAGNKLVNEGAKFFDWYDWNERNR